MRVHHPTTCDLRLRCASSCGEGAGKLDRPCSIAAAHLVPRRCKRPEDSTEASAATGEYRTERASTTECVQLVEHAIDDDDDAAVPTVARASMQEAGPWSGTAAPRWSIRPGVRRPSGSASSPPRIAEASPAPSLTSLTRLTFGPPQADVVQNRCRPRSRSPSRAPSALLIEYLRDAPGCRLVVEQHQCLRPARAARPYHLGRACSCPSSDASPQHRHPGVGLAPPETRPLGSRLRPSAIAVRHTGAAPASAPVVRRSRAALATVVFEREVDQGAELVRGGGRTS